MNESEQIFDTTFKREIEPLLLELGFSRYSLPKGWIQPTFLFKYNEQNIWYGCSWDWRDSSLDSQIGGLFKFRDVLPRVVVCGYSLVNKQKRYYNTSGYIAEQFMSVKNKLSTLADKNFEKYYQAIFNVQNERIQKLKRYFENEIVSETELPFIRC